MNRREDQLREALVKMVKWYGKRDNSDNLLPIENQTPEVAEAMQAIEGKMRWENTQTMSYHDGYGLE